MTARLAAAIVLMLAGLATAEPRIIVVETRGAPPLPALVSQVELHAGRAASVERVVARDEDPMTYAERASQLVASGQATVVVWVAPVEGGFLVFAAGSWPGRALVELVRVPAEIGPAELERTAALKLAGLLDTLLRPDAAPHAALAIAPPRRATWRIEIDGGVARESHQRGVDGRVALAAGRAWPRGGWIIAPTLAGYWQPTGAIESMPGRASVTELGAAAALDVGVEAGPIQVFARPRVVAAVLAAQGTSNDGRRGDTVVLAPYLGAELGLRRALSDAVSVGLVTGGDLALIRHELLIDGQTVVDVGRIRLHVGVLLTMSL